MDLNNYSSVSGGSSMIASIALIALGVILLNALIGYFFGQIAKMKGHSFAKYFVICIFLGLAGYIMVSALPDRAKKE